MELTDDRDASRSPGILFVGALLVELAGVAVLVSSSLVDPPLTSSDTGTLTYVDWRTACPAGDCVVTPTYEIAIANGSAVQESCCPEDWNYYFMYGAIQPGDPIPQVGQTVSVTYQDLARGRAVLSLITSPGASDSVTYVTPEKARYERSLSSGYAAFGGLTAGTLLALAGIALVYRFVRGFGPRRGAVAVAIAPISLLGAGVVLPMSVPLGGAAIARWVLTAAWLLAALGVLIAAVGSRRAGERPAAFANYSLVGVGAISAVWVGWAVIAIAGELNHAFA